mgnify:CR=1 FL=1
MVSVPYEITLLSNLNAWHNLRGYVSVPYEITLLSNRLLDVIGEFPVSVPYEITLLSNEHLIHYDYYLFQYLMKLHYSQTY